MSGFAALAFALSAVLSTQQDDGVLSLTEALALAEKQAFSIRLQESQIEIAKAQEKVSRASLSPGAQVSSTLSWFDARNSSGFGQNGSSTNTNIQFAVNQIIDISGVYRNRIRSAEFNRLAEEAKWDVETNTIRGMVRSQFFAVVQASELLSIQKATLDSAEQRLSKARIREQEGAIPRFDVLRLEVVVKQSDQGVSDAAGNFRLAKQALNNLLGRPIETEFEVEVEPAQVFSELTAEVFVKQALANRAEIRQAQLGILALEQARKAQEKAAAPTLSAGASYSKNLDPGFGQSNESTTAQLVFSFPITISGVVAANSKTAKEREEQAKINYEQIQLGIALEVQSSLTELQTAWIALDSAKKNLELSTEALRLAQLRYDEGVGILLDVTTSQNDLTQAAANVALASFRVRTAYAALQKSVGNDEFLVTPEAAGQKQEKK